MENIDNIFSTDNEIVTKLKENATKPDYNKIFFEHLGPELRKLFDKKKVQVNYKNFLKAATYEYGFFNKKIDLEAAFSLYKKHADSNDYFCMYKMHVIYLCEYEKFNVPFNRVLEQLYLLKCLAYLPNYAFDWNLKLFEKIDVLYEIAGALDLEDETLEKHTKFFDLLEKEKEKYNLSENEIYLMRGVFFCYFNSNDKEKDLIPFSTLYSLSPENDHDNVYYKAKNMCVFFRNYLKLESIMSEKEVDDFYEVIEKKQLFDLYSDYGNYLLDKYNKSNPKIIDILTIAVENGDLFSSFRVYQSLIDYYDFYELMENEEKASTILDFLLNEIVFERLLLGQFVILMGYLIKYSKFKEKIISKYLVYVKEINDYISMNLNKKENGEKINDDDDYIYAIKGDIYYFGFEGIEEKNLQKALEFFDKASNITKSNYNQKRDKFIKFEVIKEMHSLKLISDDELSKEKKDLIQFYMNNLNIKYQISDCYLLGENYFNGITMKKDEALGRFLFETAVEKRFCKIVMDWKLKSDIKQFLKNNKNDTEKIFNDDICGICYERKIEKIFIPCKHKFCSFCAELLEKDKKCPFCRNTILGMI